MRKDQIILRIDDVFGHHILRKGNGYFSIEGYQSRPENYLNPPQYYFPVDEGFVIEEFKKQGKSFR